MQSVKIEDDRLNRIIDLLEIIAYEITGCHGDAEELMTKYHEKLGVVGDED